jgi:hypothetical protein
MRLFCLLMLSASTMFVALPGSAQDKGDVKVEIVKYDGLKDAVTRNRGKVVLVDFWGTL